MVNPDYEGNDGYSPDSKDHRLVTEDGLAGEGCNHFGVETEDRKNHNVNRRMRVKPENVLIEEWVTAELGVKEVGAEISVKE